ncbi:MAG: hypothetical protein LCH74_20340 [Proteobacteria bacterium]|nr:hypothetical protein [Pseudomonadota bacterium]
MMAGLHAQVDAHVAADAVVGGRYGETDRAGKFTGCFIGCAVHSHAVLTNTVGEGVKYDDDRAVAASFGFPPPLTRICENIFEGLPRAEQPGFFKAATKAAKLGADLSLVHWRFLDWVVTDALAKYGTDDVRKGCEAAVALIKDLANGKTVTSEQADAAAADAAAAYAARAAAYAAAAARAAAYAAAAYAYAAADAAADAAYAAAADAAADAAYAAAAADADAARIEQAAKIVQFISEAA